MPGSSRARRANPVRCRGRLDARRVPRPRLPHTKRRRGQRRDRTCCCVRRDARAPAGARRAARASHDWRMHRDQRLDAPVADGHLPILDLLREPRLAAAIRCLAGAEAHAAPPCVNTQVARRTRPQAQSAPQNLSPAGHELSHRWRSKRLGEHASPSVGRQRVYSARRGADAPRAKKGGHGQPHRVSRRPPARLAPVPGLEARQGAPGHRIRARRGPAGPPATRFCARGSTPRVYRTAAAATTRIDQRVHLVFFRVQLAGVEYATPRTRS